MFIPKRLAWHFAQQLKVWVQLFQNMLKSMKSQRYMTAIRYALERPLSPQNM